VQPSLKSKILDSLSDRSIQSSSTFVTLIISRGFRKCTNSRKARVTRSMVITLGNQSATNNACRQAVSTADWPTPDSSAPFFNAARSLPRLCYACCTKRVIADVASDREYNNERRDQNLFCIDLNVRTRLDLCVHKCRMMARVAFSREIR